VLSLLAFCLSVGSVLGHGRLRDPPSRASMWRDGYKTPHDYDDDQAYCGGITALWSINKGKCGFCGDPWHQAEPRSHELGGKYGKGIITRNYTQGQEIEVYVQLTTNHRGWFEFRLCPLENPGPGHDATQECLDKHLLELADGSGTQYTIGSGMDFRVKLKLPEGLTCKHCVLQWHWRCANNWGICPDGKGAMGCGKQEWFRGCSDVSIA